MAQNSNNINTAAKSKDGGAWDFKTNSLVSGLSTLAVKQDSASYDNNYDVIVIGAGFAGLTAARDLSQKGQKVLLLEGRDRIGGRTWTAQTEYHDYEMGGGWVHYMQAHTWSEMTRYGLYDIDSSLGLDANSVLTADGKIQSLLEADTQAFRLLANFFNVDGVKGRTILPNPYLPLKNREQVAKWDISCQERIDNMNVTAAEGEAIGMWLSTFGLNDMKATGFLSVLRLYALSGYDFAQIIEMSGKFKIPGGTTALANAMYNEFKGTSLFNRKVTTISSEANSASVTTANGDTFTAKHVISTMPINVLSNITINVETTAPWNKIKHINQGGKIHIHTTNETYQSFGVSRADTMTIFGVAESRSHAGTNIVAFLSSRAPLADGIAANHAKVLNETLTNIIPAGVDVGQVNGFYWHDWRSDEFSNGTWAVYGPQMLSQGLGQLMENKKLGERIILASADLANGWVGYIDGAIEEGRRAAFDLLN